MTWIPVTGYSACKTRIDWNIENVASVSIHYRHKIVRCKISWKLKKDKVVLWGPIHKPIAIIMFYCVFEFKARIKYNCIHKCFIICNLFCSCETALESITSHCIVLTYLNTKNSVIRIYRIIKNVAELSN